MKILITGSLGFIGSHLAEHYLQQGNSVMGIDNQSGVYPDKVYQYTHSILNKHKRFSFKNLDIRSRAPLAQFVTSTQPDMIIHAAALTGIRGEPSNLHKYIENNVLGTQNLLDASKQRRHVRIILLSSSSVYGDQSRTPFDEHAILKPKSIYAISKSTMEAIAQYYAHQYKLNALVVRPFSIYGPRGRVNMLPFLLLKAAQNDTPFPVFGNDANNQRDWTYIEDFVKAFGKLVGKKLSGFDVFNIGSGDPVGIESFVTLFQQNLSQQLGLRVQIVKKPKPSYEMDITHADTTKLKSYVGEMAFTSLGGGLKKFLLYYRRHKRLYEH